MITNNRINFVLFILLACFWSGSYIAIKAVVNVWPPVFGAMVRVAIALLSLTILLVVMRKSVAIPRELKWKVWLVGLFSQAFPFTFLFWGERLVSPGLAGILNSTVSIWAFLLTLIFLPHLKIFSTNKLIGLIVGMIGIVIIFWHMLVIEKNFSTLIGAAAVLMMAVSYAAGALLNQHFLAAKHNIDFFANVYHQHCASIVFLTVVSFLFEKWPSNAVLLASSIPWAASLYLGLFSTAIAWIIYYHLIHQWDALRASTVMYLVPAMTLIWDYLFYNTHPRLSEIGGVVTILAGVVLIQLASFRLDAKWIYVFKKK